MENQRYQNKAALRKRARGKYWIIAALAFTVFFTVIGLTIYSFLLSAPELEPEKLKINSSSVLFDRDNENAGTISGKEYRKMVKIKDVPEHVINAFIAVEDIRFYEHEGLDVKRLGGAVIANVTEGYGSEGGSTITQQLVKNAFLKPEKSIKRKVQEAYLAMQVEKEYSKEKILEMYLNKIYFGSGAYGVGTAAEIYFNKTVKELTISEAALLAGLPQRPSGYNPLKHPKVAEERRNIVLKQMEKYDFIDDKQYAEAKKTSVANLLKPSKRESKYAAFIDQVIREAQEMGISEDDLFNGGLRIYTTLDPDAQLYTEKVISTNELVPFPDDKIKSGVVLMDTKSGEIRAIGGYRSKDVRRGLNYATQIKRQPGSTAKPILAYGPGIEHDKWSTYQQFKDEPLELNGKKFRNWDGRYHGELSMREALKMSYNIPAIKAFLKSGDDRAKDFANKLGIPMKKVYPSYAIGGFETGISPMQLAGAYAAFGNEGVYNKPHTIRKVVYPDGEEVKPDVEPVQAMQDYTAYMMTDMLKDVVREGTGRDAFIDGVPVAGKTGTTSLPAGIEGEGTSDAWFAGYTTQYTAAVWTGYDKTTQETFIQKKDDDLSKLIFKQIMSHVSRKGKTEDFKMPASVVELEIDQSNGLVASKFTPSVRTTKELFVKGTEPEKKASFWDIFFRGDKDDKKKEKEREKREKKQEKERKKREKEKEKRKKERKEKDDGDDDDD